MASGTVTVTYQEHRTVRRVTIAWTSAADGTANGTATRTISGLIHRVVTNPDGTAAPTDDYDLVLNDQDGVDVMAAALANRDTANTEQVIPDPPVAVDGTLELQVTNAGNAKSGTVEIYMR